MEIVREDVIPVINFTPNCHWFFQFWGHVEEETLAFASFEMQLHKTSHKVSTF